MNQPERTGAGQPDDLLQQLRTVTTVIYALQAASFLAGITLIAAVIVNYIKRDDVRGTWLASHFRWQIRTFWFSLLLGVVGGITALIGIGFIILAADVIWLIYRIAKGWLRLSEGNEMYPVA